MAASRKRVQAKKSAPALKRKAAKTEPKSRKASRKETKTTAKQTTILSFFKKQPGPSSVGNDTPLSGNSVPSPPSAKPTSKSTTLLPPPCPTPSPPLKRKLDYARVPVPDPGLEQCSMDLSKQAEVERAAVAIAAEATGAAGGTEDAAPATAPTADIDIDQEQELVHSRLLHFDTSLDDAGAQSEPAAPAPAAAPAERDDTLDMLACDESSVVLSAAVSSAPPATAPAVSVTTASPAIPAVDGDGDAVMGTPAAPAPMSPHSPPDARSTGGVDEASDSDSDSDDEFLAAAARRTAMIAPRRRSARISANEDAVPRESAFQGSVFGSRVAGTSRGASQMTNTLAALVRDRDRREKAQAKLEEMRNDLEGDGTRVLDEDEKLFASMAESENRNEAARAALHDKYHCPVALFLGKVAFPPQNDVHWVRPTIPTHPVHDMLLTACRVDRNLSMAVFASQVEFMCRAKFPPPNFVAEMLFYRIVFDPTEDVAGRFSREQELQSLLTIISCATAELPLPPMLAVLESYGARFNANNASAAAVNGAPEESLDKSVMTKGDGLPVGVEIALRNLGRAFCVWTAQVDSDMDLCQLFGREKPKQALLSEEATYGLAIVQLCVQILLSPFGSRLKIPVARLLEAILDRVKDEEWCLFRQRAAKSIIGFTPRLGLHCELVTYLFPIRTRRTRHLGLDIAFLSLRQWHAGPGDNPVPASIDGVWPESAIKGSEKEGISFTFADILECMQNVPDFGKETDVVWGCGIARILKQVTVESDVLATRKEGDIAKIQGVIKKMRVCSHRMSFGVPVQDMRLALDALLSAMKGFLGNSKSVKKELHPMLKDEPVQATIASMLGNAKQ